MRTNMHDLSMAQNILEMALDQAEQYNGKRISALVVKLGKANHVKPDSLEFCLREAAKGTIAEKATMQIEALEPTTKCRDCNNAFSIQRKEKICRSCGSENLETFTDSDALLERVELEVD